MKKYFLVLLCSYATILYGQTNLKQLRPTKVEVKDISHKAIQSYNAKAQELRATEKRLQNESNKDSRKESELQHFYEQNEADLDRAFHELENATSCSWYCGGGLTDFLSSSHLKSQAGNKYLAQQAFDFDISTAWVEGVQGNGEGETIQALINSGRIHTINIYNGYQKNITTFLNNARVKRLELSINNKPYAILHLEDKTGLQSFTIPEISTSGEKPVLFRFKILEVYPGEKYQDTAISAIIFDGPHH